MKRQSMTEHEFNWEIFNFNQSRNEFELNGENELKMLAEEADEYFILANSTAERLDALVDFEFVFGGTQMKVSAKFNPVDPMIDLMCQNTVSTMKSILMGELGMDEDEFEQVHAQARYIVVKSNELKPKEVDENGKVIKEELHPDATPIIADMLKNL